METFLFAGHDTSASLIGWTLYELARHPKVAQQLVDELTASPAAASELIDLEKFPYLKAVLNESLRLHPPVPSNARKSTVARTFHWTDHAGIAHDAHIPAGTALMVNFLSMAWNPDTFPNPQKFDPDRFMDENVNAARHPYAFVPFGGGPRRCIGEKLALLEVRTVIVALLSKYRFESLEEAVPEQSTTLSSRNGLVMRLHTCAK